LSEATTGDIEQVSGSASAREVPAASRKSGYRRALRSTSHGKLLATASSDATVKLWDTQTGRDRATLAGHEGAVWSVAFRPDGKTVASGGEEQTIKLWDVRTGRNLATLRRHKGAVRVVAFSPDGRTVASGGVDGAVRLWDVTPR
jgi:WD40 repeat protein